jgi:hypothetical protein
MSQHEQADTQQLPDLIERDEIKPKTGTKRKRVVTDDDDAPAAGTEKPKRTYKKKKVSGITNTIHCNGPVTSTITLGDAITITGYGESGKNLRWFTTNAPVLITKRVMCYESSDSSSFSDSE